MPTANAHLLADLRQQLRTLERGGQMRTAERAALPFAVDVLDRLWPEHGLPLGVLHEVASSDATSGFAAVTTFAAAIAGRLRQPVLWCARDDTLYAPGLANAGLNPARLLIARLHSDQQILAAMEEALRHDTLGCVIGEVKALDLKASRRLQLAAEKSGVTVFVLRQQIKAIGADPIAAVSRWRITAAPSSPHPIPAAGQPRWRLELLRSHYGTTGSWIVEAPDAQGYLHLPAVLADRSPAQTHEPQHRAG